MLEVKRTEEGDDSANKEEVGAGIRNSRKSSAADAKLDRRHQTEVAALKKELDYWKKQAKRTKMNVIDEKTVRKGRLCHNRAS